MKSIHAQTAAADRSGFAPVLGSAIPMALTLLMLLTAGVRMM